MTELPTSWALAPLRELVDMLDHRRIPVSAKERTRRLGQVPYYGATGQVGWIDEPLFNEDLLLLGEDGVQFFDHNKPKAYIVSGPSWVNNHAHVLRADELTTSNRYLFYFLNNFDYHGYATGTTRLKLTKSAMSEIPVKLPPLVEQHRIVAALEDHLSRLDVGARLVENAQDRGHALRRSSITELTNRVEDDWVVLTIGDMASVTSGATPLRSRCDYYNGSIPWVTSTLLNRAFVDDAEQHVTEKALKESSLKLLKPGTLLLAMYGEGQTRGRCSELRIAATTNQACAAISLNDEYEDRRPWIKLSLEAMYEQNRKLAVGGVQPNLNLSLIRKIRINLPPAEKQDDLLVEAEALRTSTVRVASESSMVLARAAQLRRLLLTEAFAGRLLPQDSNDEPASVLLERNRAERAEQPKAKRTRRATPPIQETLL
jgi:type I restriction enzyme S subunit